MIIVEYLTYIIARVFIIICNLLPYNFRIFAGKTLFSFIIFFVPKYKKIIYKNFSLAFPKKSQEELDLIYEDSKKSLSKFVIDSLRLPNLNEAWVKKHVKFPQLAEYQELELSSKNGIFLCSGHVDSFELLPFALSYYSKPISFVVRPFKNKFLDKWWSDVRGRAGNSMIQRNGAIRSLVKKLKKGHNAGLLFDQNVVRKDAVFVDWFGRPASTTKALGYIALVTRAPTIVLCIKSLENDMFEVRFKHCDFNHIFNNDDLSKEEKMIEITKIATSEQEKIILDNPSAWFWMHRRWKTTPEESIPEDFYT